MRVLAELPVLEKLDGQVCRINLRLDVRSERRERVERFGARVLALGILDVPVTDVLRRRVAENVARCRSRRDVANLPGDDDGEFRLEVGAMRRMRNFNLPAVRQQLGRSLDPDERFFGQRLVLFPRVIGVIQADSDDLGRNDGDEGAHAFARSGFLVERRRPEDVAVQSENFSVHNLRVEDVLAFLESSDGSHKCGGKLTSRDSRSQG